jgi:ferredoxin-type protein NapF
LGGAAVGYPLFLWLDPLAIFAGFVHAWGRELGLAVWLSAAGLPLVLLISLLVPGVWCARLCPLGATQDLLAWPLRTIRRRGPDDAAAPDAWPLTRRAIVAGGLGVFGGLQMFRLSSRSSAAPLRPPGAADGDRFTGLCVRCGSCARVCPSRIVHPDLGEFGADSFLTPVIRYQDEYCLESCQRCTNVCPSGALRPLSAEEKPQAAIGLPRVDMDVCLLGDDRECAICCNACPYAAIRLVFSEDIYLNTPTIDPQRCNGCGACQVRCPTTPVKAIMVYPPAAT